MAAALCRDFAASWFGAVFWRRFYLVWSQFSRPQCSAIPGAGTALAGAALGLGGILPVSVIDWPAVEPAIHGLGQLVISGSTGQYNRRAWFGLAGTDQRRPFGQSSKLGAPHQRGFGSG